MCAPVCDLYSEESLHTCDIFELKWPLKRYISIDWILYVAEKDVSTPAPTPPQQN